MMNLTQRSSSVGGGDSAPAARQLFGPPFLSTRTTKRIERDFYADNNVPRTDCSEAATPRRIPLTQQPLHPPDRRSGYPVWERPVGPLIAAMGLGV